MWFISRWLNCCFYEIGFEHVNMHNTLYTTFHLLIWIAKGIFQHIVP